MQAGLDIRVLAKLVTAWDVIQVPIFVPEEGFPWSLWYFPVTPVCFGASLIIVVAMAHLANPGSVIFCPNRT